jgi:hypothetical protein
MIATLALLAALRADPDAAGCRPDELQAAAKSAQISELGRANGADVVLAGPHAACLCGNVNCPWYVLRLAGSPPAVLLQTFGYAADTVAAGGTLPGLRVTSHDSALISYETDYAYRDGAYVAAETWIVRGDTGVRKRVDVPVRFAPGTSSATLHGSISMDWGDSYAFVASHGQRLTLDAVRAKPGVTFEVSSVDGAHHATLVPGVATTLPASGAYTLLIGTDAADATPYAFTMTIR